MTCAAKATCKTHKSVTPKHGEIDKTGPRYIRDGINYPECSLLQLGADGIYEPWTKYDDPSAIKAAMICAIDTTDWVEPCSVGVVLQGCLIADFTCWGKATPDQIEAVVQCSNCCLVFYWLANECPILEEEPDPGKAAEAPKPIDELAAPVATA
jgi:hypothetical protein